MDSVWGMHNWPAMKVGRAAEHAGTGIAGADVSIFTIALGIRKSFLQQIGSVTRTGAGTTRRDVSRGARSSFSPNKDNKDGVVFAQALISEFLTGRDKL